MRLAVLCGIVFGAAGWFVHGELTPDRWTPVAYPQGISGGPVWGPPVSSAEDCFRWITAQFDASVEYECGRSCTYEPESDWIVCEETVDDLEGR